MAAEDVVLRVRVEGDEAAATLQALGRQLDEIGGAAGTPRASPETGGSGEAGRGVPEGDELVAATRDLVGLARLIAERIDQLRQTLAGLVEMIGGEEDVA